MEFLNMARMNKITGVIATAGLLTGLTLAGAPAFAQTAAPATPPAVSPATPGNGMMGRGMPSGQAAMNSEMMQKMAKMMDGCNNMMEAMAREKAAAPTPAAPANKG